MADLSESRRFSNALGSWLSIVGYLMVREFDQKFRGNRFSVVLAIAEPILLLCLMLTLRGLFRGLFPAYGLSTVGFLFFRHFPLSILSCACHIELARQSTILRNACPASASPPC